MAYQINPFTGKLDITPFSLDGAGKIPSDYLPSYVDDVVEYDDFASFPGTGETGKIYVAKDTGYTYRWTGSVYVRIGSGGEVELNLGSDSSPSLYFTGDPNTGIYSPGADQLALSTSGTGRLFVDASGYIGNRANPFGDLDIDGARGIYSRGSSQGLIALDDKGVADTSTPIRWMSSDGGNHIFYAANRAASGGSTGSVEHLRITAAGFVGIGTSSPTDVLHVVGDGGVSDNSANSLAESVSNAKIRFQSRSGSSLSEFQGTVAGGGAWYSQIANGTGTTSYNQVFNPFGGNVGIGTTSPGSPLHVTSSSAGALVNITSTSTSAALVFNDSGTGGNYPKIGSEGSNLVLRGGSISNAAYIDSSGRLLVGTSTSLAQNGSSTAPGFQLTGGDQARAAIHRHNADAFANGLTIGKARGSSYQILSPGDQIGFVNFSGADGNVTRASSTITSFVEGTPAAGSIASRLVFSTTADGASSPTEQLRITSDRYVRLASGTGGIQFNGDTAAANALDDYEEGTFTLTIADAPSGGNTGTSNTCLYTKVGRTVIITGSLFTIDTTGLTAGNTVYFQGLPFAPLTHNSVGSITIENITFSGFVTAQCSPSATAFRLAQSSSGSTEAYLQVSALAAGADIVAFQLSYSTAA